MPNESCTVRREEASTDAILLAASRLSLIGHQRSPGRCWLLTFVLLAGCCGEEQVGTIQWGFSTLRTCGL